MCEGVGRQWLGLLAAVWLLAAGAAGAQEFEAHRMIQYDRDDKRYGSRKTALDAVAATLDSGPLSNRVLMVHMSELTEPTIESILSGTFCAAVLVILPPDLEELAPEAKATWAGFERRLLRSEVQMPVYFSFRGPQLDEVYSRVDSPGSATDGFQLLVNQPEASKIGAVHGVNLQGMLSGAGEQGDGDNLPTLAIVAHYDTIGVAPSLVHGADDGGSGVVALLELARMFSKLYKRLRTQGKYNLLFVLTGAGRVNFSGTRHWLEHADVQLLQSIEFALCLDRIGRGERLNLHVSKPAKDRDTANLFAEFKRTANQTGLPFQVAHRKIDLSDREVYWQHEQFSRKKLLSGTLSHQSAAKPWFEPAAIVDTQVQLPALRRNIVFIAEVLARHVYGLHGQQVQVFNQSLGLNEHFVEAWHSVLATEERMQVLLSPVSKDPRATRLISGLEKVLSKYTEGSVRTELFPVSSDVTFYDQARVTVQGFAVTPIWFDVGFSVVIGSYLVTLLVALVGARRGCELVASEFKRLLPSSRKPSSKKTR